MVALITERYLIHAISYAGHHRREAIQYPEDSLRESVLNAITNKDYTSGYPIQISVYPDHLSVWNYGQLPEGWTVGKLFIKHPSMPFNPSLAGAYFRSVCYRNWKVYWNKWGMVPVHIIGYAFTKWLINGSFVKGMFYWASL